VTRGEQSSTREGAFSGWPYLKEERVDIPVKLNDAIEEENERDFKCS
jgi:hypothetical protein